MKPLWGLIGKLDVNMQFYFGVTGIVCGLFIFRSFEYLNTYSDASFNVWLTSMCRCRYLHFQKKLSAITSTIRNVATDLMHLFFVLALAVQLFAFIAMIVFGDELIKFNTYSDASFNVWLMTLKIFEFEEADHEFVDSSQLYYFRIFFELVIMTVLMKMVIAILIGGYEAIHEQQEHAHEHITTVPEDIA